MFAILFIPVTLDFFLIIHNHVSLEHFSIKICEWTGLYALYNVQFENFVSMLLQKKTLKTSFWWYYKRHESQFQDEMVIAGVAI